MDIQPESLKKFAKKIIKLDIPLHAAGLTFYSILSLIPTLGLIFYYLTHLFLTPEVVDKSKKFLFAQLSPDSGSMLVPYFEKFMGAIQRGSWNLLGTVLLIYTALSLLNRFGESVDTIFVSQHPDSKKQIWYRVFLRRLLFLFVIPFVFVLSYVVMEWVKQDSIIHTVFKLKTFGPILALPLSWAINMIALFLIYTGVSSFRVSLRSALWAALIVTPLLEVTKFLMGIYSHYSVSVHKVYGVFSSVPLFFLWLQFAWMVILMGALRLMPRAQ